MTTIGNSRRGELASELARARSDLKAAARGRHGVDAAGWSVLDHLAHVLAWEGALLSVLTGGSTPAALGYSREEYERMGTDALNQQVLERFRDGDTATFERLDSTRASLERALVSLTDADLEARFEEVRQWEAPGQPQWTVWDWLLAYAPAHDAEHAQYIQALKEND